MRVRVRISLCVYIRVHAGVRACVCACVWAWDCVCVRMHAQGHRSLAPAHVLCVSAHLLEHLTHTHLQLRLPALLPCH